MAVPLWSKWFAAIIVVGALVVPTGAAEPGPLRVATFSCDVTPPAGGQPLIWVTPVETVEEPLLAKGVILDDGQQRCVLCAVDWCGLCNSSHLLFRSKLAKAVGTDVSRVGVQCVHQHTAPYVDGDAQRLLDRTQSPPRYVDLKFLDELTDRLGAAAKGAIDKLEPVDAVGTAVAKVDRVASSRRIITPDGRFHGRMSSAKSAELRALPEGFIDPMLRTVTLARGRKPLVRLHYYATHPQSFYGDPRVSSDFVGLAREQLEQEEGVPQVYFTGCAGDVAAGKYNDGTPRAREELTGRLLAGMKAAAAATRFEPAAGIHWRTVPLVLPLKTTAGFSLPELRATMADVREPPHLRILAARRIAFHRRVDRPLELSALHCGRIRLLHLPGEPMVAFQLYAQQLLPDDFVAVAGYGDGCTNYICTEQAFQEGGYEPSASTVGPQSEKLLTAAIDRLLEPPT